VAHAALRVARAGANRALRKMGTPNELVNANPAEHALGRIFDSAPIRILALLLLLTAAPVYAAFSSNTALFNGDIWWHLRTGLWILQNHSIPRSGLFSQYVNRPWVDSSWGFDVLTAGASKLLSLRAFPVLLMSFKLALAAVTFLLARGRHGNFWCAVLLSAIAQYVIVDLLPLPVLSSILFFAVELLLLLQSRRCNDVRTLFWLPVLFFFWANLHGQFLNGLLLLGLYLAAEVTEYLLHISGVSAFSAPAHSLAKVAAIAGLSVIATLLTPYSFQLFKGAFETAYGKVLFENFQEMQAFAFRRPQHFVLLLLVMAAFLALGRQRSRDLFKLSVISIFVMLTFRVQRDVWCVVFPAIAVIADAVAGWQHEPELRKSGRRSKQTWKWETPLLAVLVLVVFLAAAIRIPGSEALMNQVSRVFPVKACDFIRANQLPGPMFNAYSWGGFLTWYLPEYPVSIDGRLNLYGDEINERYFKVIDGTQRLETDPGFTGARIILLERDSGMLKALTTLPALREQFRVAYQDDVAAVVVRQ
jgi:hypothetical protein